MYDLIGDPEIIEELGKLFYHSRIEKIFLASTIRTCGLIGEQYLLKELKKTKDYSVKVAIISALYYKVPITPNYIKLKLIKPKSKSNNYQHFLTYKGKLYFNSFAYFNL